MPLFYTNLFNGTYHRQTRPQGKSAPLPIDRSRADRCRHSRRSPNDQMLDKYPCLKVDNRLSLSEEEIFNIVITSLGPLIVRGKVHSIALTKVGSIVRNMGYVTVVPFINFIKLEALLISTSGECEANIADA